MGSLGSGSPELTRADQGDAGRRSHARGRLPSVHLSPAVQGLVALAVYAAVAVAFVVRPLVLHASSAQLYQKNPDPNFYVWSLRWWPYAIGHGLDPLYTHQIGAPAGYALAWITTIPPLAVLAAPLTLLAGPVVSFSLLTAAAMPLSAWAAFVLGRRLTGKFWPALVGGAVFGFSAYELGHVSAGQLNLAYSLLLPLLAYLVVLWRDGSIGSRTFVMLAAVGLALQFYLFLETFADLTAIVVISFLLGLALAGRAGRPELLRLARLVGLAYVIALVLAAPYLVSALSTKAPTLVAVSGTDLASLVIPAPGRTFGIGWLAHLAAGPVASSQASYIGIPLLVLAILLAVTGWSSRLVRFLSCLLVLVIVASLGSVAYLDGHRLVTLPWSRIWQLPILRNAWPTRLMLFAFLVLAVMAALWLARPSANAVIGGARWLLAGLAIAAMALAVTPLNVASRSNVPSFITAGDYRQELTPGEIVVVVSKVGDAGMLWQAASGFYMRVAGGYINAGVSQRGDGPGIPAQVFALRDATNFKLGQFVAYVKGSHVGAILVDVNQEPAWAGIFQRVGLVGHRVGNVVVYPTDGCRSCLTRLPRGALGQ
jgi:hypothetical protein